MLKSKLKLEFIFVAVVAVAVCGCRDKSALGRVQQANSTNIQKLANLYNQFQATNSFVGPNSVDELRDYVKNEVPDFIKERIDLTADDDIFVSERDGQPFKIRLEVVGSARGCTEPAIFEAEGVNGKYLVGFLNMTTREVEKDEYDQLWDGNAS